MVDEFNLVRSLHKQDLLILIAQLPIVIIAPGEHLAFCSQKAREEITADDLDDRNAEVDHVGD